MAKKIPPGGGRGKKPPKKKGRHQPPVGPASQRGPSIRMPKWQEQILAKDVRPTQADIAQNEQLRVIENLRFPKKL